MPCGLLAGTQYFLRHQTTIDRHAERQTHAGISSRSLLGIEGIIVSAKLRRGINLARNILQQFLIHVFRKGFSDINITRKVALGGCRFLINGQEGNFLQNRFAVVPVMRIRYNDQFFIYDAIFEHIGAVTNQIPRFGPLFAAFDVGFLYRIKCKTCRQVGKPGERFIQLNFQCTRIDCANAKLIRRCFAIDDRLSIANTRQRSKPRKR